MLAGLDEGAVCGDGVKLLILRGAGLPEQPCGPAQKGAEVSDDFPKCLGQAMLVKRISKAADRSADQGQIGDVPAAG